MDKKTLKAIQESFDKVSDAIRLMSNALISLASRVLTVKEYEEFVDSLKEEEKK